MKTRSKAKVPGTNNSLFGYPSKMPCPSWDISANRCQKGMRLRKEFDNSVCSQCYCFKGRQLRSNVQQCYEARYEHWERDPYQWIKDMAEAIEASGTSWFRWFSSGDVQSIDMFHAIQIVCHMTPKVRHWLPTKEWYYTHCVNVSNLIVRKSYFFIDQPKSDIKRADMPHPHMSMVYTDEAKVPRWAYKCPAYASKPANCGSCRACWDKRIKLIAYPLH